MCLIVRGSVANLLRLDLRKAQDCNADGWGIHLADRVVYSFLFDDPEWDVRDALRTFPSDAIATVHFRFATHGNTTRDNAHPHLIRKNLFLMHNGMIRGSFFRCPEGIKSDTAILADLLRRLPISRQFDLLSDYAMDNRFCLLKGSTWKKFGNWHYDNVTDTWHSNRQLLPTWATKGKSKRSWCGTGNTMVWEDDIVSDYASDPFFASDSDSTWATTKEWRKRYEF
jgi:predicted glutamine amidotransferase